MSRVFALVLVCSLYFLAVPARALTYAEYLAEQGEEVEESEQEIHSSAGESSINNTIYIDNTRVLDSGAVVLVDSLTVQADTVVMAVPENNVYPPGAPLAGGVYMQVTTNQLGKVMIYVPASFQFKSFTFIAGTETPVNLMSSTISGYTYTSADYSIRWTSFGQAQYRPSSGSSSYTNLDITAVLNTNIVFVEGVEDLPVVPDSNMLQVITVFLLGVMVVCLFMRRL